MTIYPQLDIPETLAAGPGPGNTDPRVLERFAKTGVADHMQKDVLRGMLEAKEMLRDLWGTKNVYTYGVAGTGFSDWLDASRRVWWAQEGEPERPSHPDVRFLEKHRSADGDYSTYADDSATGASTTPARGFTAEQWAQMNSHEQKLARGRQYQDDAEEQRQWEAKARADSEARQA